MNFDTVITTYNRPLEVFKLANQILQCSPAPDSLIVVDSSDEANLSLESLSIVKYLRSSHKNQPYQRLLGATVATSDIVVFLDDDLDITNPNIFEIIRAEFSEDSIVGVTVGIDYHSAIGDQMDEAIFMSIDRTVVKSIHKLTGVILPPLGKVGRLGIVGKKPNTKDSIEFFYGPCLSFRRNIILKIIPDDLLSQVERRLSMGEDKVISLSALQYGKLLYIPEVCLLHPPNDSTYFQNIRSFTAKVTYSRLYLSRIYAQVFKKPWWREVLIYYWFTSWRVLIALFSLLLRPSKGRKYKLLGTLDGLWLALRLPQKAERLTPGINWESEIQKDLTNARRGTSRI